MTAFYVDKIRRGSMALEEVPKLWRRKVEQALQEE